MTELKKSDNNKAQKEYKFWLEYRLHKDGTFVASGYYDEASMKIDKKALRKLGYKLKIKEVKC